MRVTPQELPGRVGVAAKISEMHHDLVVKCEVNDSQTDLSELTVPHRREEEVWGVHVRSRSVSSKVIIVVDTGYKFYFSSLITLFVLPVSSVTSIYMIFLTKSPLDCVLRITGQDQRLILNSVCFSLTCLFKQLTMFITGEGQRTILNSVCRSRICLSYIALRNRSRRYCPDFSLLETSY